jgi:3-phosphoshikimate 1-carboxyvinyltransferase
MSLPEVIEIVPPESELQAAITVPGSKSITNRALILAALANGVTELRGALWSEDTQVMVEDLRKLGFVVEVSADPQEPCNRTIVVTGLNGVIPGPRHSESPLTLFVGNAGTAARFLSALVCLGHGEYRLHGVPRMHERPQAALFQALRALGYRVDSPNDKLPATIFGTGPRVGRCVVSIEESSQFASALLLCARIGNWKVEVKGENAEESPYARMTAKLLDSFPANGGIFQIEPDASSGSYFLGAGWLLRTTSLPVGGSNVAVNHWPATGWQIDQDFQRFFGVDTDRRVAKQPSEPNSVVISREQDLGDSIMTAIILASFMKHSVRFTDLRRLRMQETERVTALRTELLKCGARISEHGDTLEVQPASLRGATINTYNDHRMAMCFAVLGLKVPGIKIQNPACVKKTFPNFFQKLSTPPPRGMGITILDGTTRAAIDFDDLFAQ